jgi:hypothetical protein
LVAYNKPFGFGTGLIRPGTVLLYTGGDYKVTAPVTLHKLSLDRSDGIEALMFRVIFMASPTRTTASPAGAFCVVWPVRDYGPSYPPEGLELKKGEIISVSVFARATRPGHATAHGLRLDYENGKQRRLVDPARTEVEMEVSDTGTPQCVPASDSAFARP